MGRHHGALAGHKGAELLAQGLVALGCTVLQCRTRVFAQRFVNSLLDAFNIKHGWVWKAARKTNNARLAQQFEKLANSRGFYVLKTIGKRQGHVIHIKKD